MSKQGIVKTCGEVEVYLHAFLGLALGKGERLASSSGRFSSAERPPPADSHWTGGWVSPKAGLDAEAKKELTTPAGNRTPVVQPVA
jgi:hypothetical protein